MKRRNFLGLFGGAIAAPLIPLPAAAAAQAAYSKSALHGAMMLAQTRGAFSVWGLANAVKIPVAQAEVLMGDLAKRGIVGPLQGTTLGGRWATSRILLSDSLVASKALRQSKANAAKLTTPKTAEADLSTMIAHLRQVCIEYGMILHPRCALT